MRKYLIISLSLLAFLLFSSKECDSPEDENAAKEEIALKANLDSINKAFEADYLSEQSLRAFELKAKQKLADLADYLQIYRDKSLDESFKDHTRKMILDLFISGNVNIDLEVSDEMKENNPAINEFLDMDASPGLNFREFRFDSIEISEPLHRVDEFHYTGSIGFSQRYEFLSVTNPANTGSLNRKVDIIATKVRKHFGSDTLQIWKVYLGEIR